MYVYVYVCVYMFSCNGMFMLILRGKLLKIQIYSIDIASIKNVEDISSNVLRTKKW